MAFFYKYGKTKDNFLGWLENFPILPKKVQNHSKLTHDGSAMMRSSFFCFHHSSAFYDCQVYSACALSRYSALPKGDFHVLVKLMTFDFAALEGKVSALISGEGLASPQGSR